MWPLLAGYKFEGLGAVLVFVTMPNFKSANFLSTSEAGDVPFGKPKHVKPTRGEVDVQNHLFKH